MTRKVHKMDPRRFNVDGSTIRTPAAARASELLQRNSGRVILGALFLTALLVVPLLTMEPGESASRDPSGAVFDLKDDIDLRFESAIHANSYIVESRGEDLLTQVSLLELYTNTQRLLAADAAGELAPDDLPAQPYLYQGFDLITNRPIVGVSSIADSVQMALADPRMGLALETATDDQIKLVLDALFSDPKTSDLKDLLSVDARSERRTVAGLEIDYWVSPAVLVTVGADNEKLGGGTSRGGLGVDDTVIDKERFDRNVQDILRGDQETFRVWGIAIDQNLEAEDEGQTAGMFVMFTVIGALVVVGISLRSYWAMALTGVGLGALMLWLKGLSNLVGLKSDLIIDLIVPIAMISLGVDFAVHAIRRYHEERAAGYLPQRALAVGFAGVLGALVLAMLTDGIAFLSNASSGIEAVIHFGLAASIAVVSSFMVLGLVVPLALARVDALRGYSPRRASLPIRASIGFASVAVSALCATAVLLLVVGISVPGLVVLLLTAALFLALPMLVLRRRHARILPAEDVPDNFMPRAGKESERGRLPDLVAGLAHRRVVVLPVMALITAGSIFLALRLNAELDVKDFFDSGSDFVVSLDKLDEHVGERGGEPAVIYVRGDLAEPKALVALRDLMLRLGENPYVGRDTEGAPSVWENHVLRMLEEVTASSYARDRVEGVTGVSISDGDGDAIPDTRDQIRAVYDYIVRLGVPRDEGILVFDAAQVREVLHHPENGDNVTFFRLGVPGTREQATVAAAKGALLDDLGVLASTPSIHEYGLTGSPFIREAQLKATTATLQRSLPIAAVAAFVLLVVAMRSLRYAVVTIAPIGLVVAWLFALMYLLGFSLNFVTATIGAVSIGVGLDYSVHLTERFREELFRRGDRVQALRYAASGTGVALVASAASSIVGFTILGLAPMPMFSSFGFLTAAMVFLALAASLVVLPSLLLVVTPEKGLLPKPAHASDPSGPGTGSFVDTP